MMLQERTSNIDTQEYNNKELSEWSYSHVYEDYESPALCLTEEQLQMLGDYFLNFTLDTNCSAGNTSFTGSHAATLQNYL